MSDEEPSVPEKVLTSAKGQLDGDEHPFGWMQDGVFELFDREGRLYRWQTGAELVDVTDDLP